MDMDEPTKQHHDHTELALGGQLSIQEDDQGAFTNSNCKKDMGDHDEGRAGPRTLFGKKMRYWVLMVASSAALMVGQSAAVVLGRYYYVHGGSRRWVYTWILSMGWPVSVLPLVVFCCSRRESGGITSLLHRICPTHVSTLRMCLIYVGLGAITVVDNLLYSLGTSYLPVSTNALLSSSQLVFTAFFSYLLVQHKMTGYILNSIFIITAGTVLLGVSSSSDKPAGTSNAEYIIGFVVTIAAAALVALLLPLFELLYKFLAKQTHPCAALSFELGALPMKTMGAQKLPSEHIEISTTTTTTTTSSSIRSILLVLEVQIVVNIIASGIAFVAMCINGDLAAMREEALHFDKGVLAYVMCLSGSGIGWQLCYVGMSGIIILSSALMACVFSTAMIPILPVLGVIIFHDSFSAVKGIAMMLSVWGFMSYIYDGYLAQKNGSTDQS